MKKLTLLLLALLYVTLTYAYTERDLLQKQADINRLKEILVLDRQWVTYPDYNDRAGWDRFLGTFKDEYIRRGEKRLCPPRPAGVRRLGGPGLCEEGGVRCRVFSVRPSPAARPGSPGRTPPMWPGACGWAPGRR